jgi:hypothetical protein
MNLLSPELTGKFLQVGIKQRAQATQPGLIPKENLST